MAVRTVSATTTTPAYLVTTGGRGRAVYVNDAFKGSVEPLRTPGFFAVRDIDRVPLENPDDADGLWTEERDALDFLARL